MWGAWKARPKSLDSILQVILQEAMKFGGKLNIEPRFLKIFLLASADCTGGQEEVEGKAIPLIGVHTSLGEASEWGSRAAAAGAE